ncbi:MAG: XRE family transcriptional regulator [Candidatus Tectomicrobia bacterium]|uniref:XRE family transcriptional regulator n=1 Tax=Tectimicrobiota bacterium TaxID=2528274 RepID=A0A932MPE3_UNCTE|nr:XRE family transcriptional regulator [Candidatus Tectomicrobia bacterium]
MTRKLETVHGSGNVYRDFGRPDADIRQAKALLAAQIIKILDDEGLSLRQAEKRSGVSNADFSRIRNADLGRFTIDRLMAILNRLDRRVEVRVKVTAAG